MQEKEEEEAPKKKKKKKKKKAGIVWGCVCLMALVAFQAKLRSLLSALWSPEAEEDEVFWAEETEALRTPGLPKQDRQGKCLERRRLRLASLGTCRGLGTKEGEREKTCMEHVKHQEKDG